MMMQKTDMQGSTYGATGATRLAENLAEKAGTNLGQLQQTAQQTVDRVSEAASQTADRVTEAASQAARQLSAHTDELWAMQERALDSTRTYVKAHPIAAVGIAVAIGLLLSKLTSRR
jgi:ElaB/YqjD/DUF883 family membrane-anchored ribosome-binding protein